MLRTGADTVAPLRARRRFVMPLLAVTVINHAQQVAEEGTIRDQYGLLRLLYPKALVLPAHRRFDSVSRQSSTSPELLPSFYSG
jgi:hypothetical protein